MRGARSVALDRAREAGPAIDARDDAELEGLGVHRELLGKRLVELEMDRQASPTARRRRDTDVEKQLLLGKLEERADRRQRPQITCVVLGTEGTARLRPELDPARQLAHVVRLAARPHEVALERVV